MRLVERVEHLALQLHARDAGILAGDPPGDQLAQLGDDFGAQRLGELVVDRRADGLGHLLDLDLEYGVLAGQRRSPDSRRGNFALTSRSSPALAPLRPSTKPGMKLLCPTTSWTSSPLPPSNSSPSIAADEVDGDAVALAGRPVRLDLVA